MGTSISCVSADDDQSWEWTKGLMQVPLAWLSLSRFWHLSSSSSTLETFRSWAQIASWVWP